VLLALGTALSITLFVELVRHKLRRNERAKASVV
jgi:hypothetical protein